MSVYNKYLDLRVGNHFIGDTLKLNFKVNLGGLTFVIIIKNKQVMNGER